MQVHQLQKWKAHVSQSLRALQNEPLFIVREILPRVRQKDYNNSRLEKRIYQEAEMNYFILKDRLIKKLLEIKRLYMRDKGLFQLKERALSNKIKNEVFRLNIPRVDSNSNINEGFKPVVAVPPRKEAGGCSSGLCEASHLQKCLKKVKIEKENPANGN